MRTERIFGFTILYFVPSLHAVRSQEPSVSPIVLEDVGHTNVVYLFTNADSQSLYYRLLNNSGHELNVKIDENQY